MSAGLAIQESATSDMGSIMSERAQVTPKLFGRDMLCTYRSNELTRWDLEIALWKVTVVDAPEHHNPAAIMEFCGIHSTERRSYHETVESAAAHLEAALRQWAREIIEISGAIVRFR